MDREAWWGTVHRVPKSQTWLKWLSTCACTHRAGKSLKMEQAPGTHWDACWQWSDGFNRHSVTLPPSPQAPHQNTTTACCSAKCPGHVLHTVNWRTLAVLSFIISTCHSALQWPSTPFRGKQKALHDSRHALASSDGDLVCSPCQTPPRLPEPTIPSLGPWPPHLCPAPAETVFFTLLYSSLSSCIRHQSLPCCLTVPYPRSFSYCVFTPTSPS